MAKALAALTLGLCIAFSAFAAAPAKKPPDWSQLTPEQQQVLAPLASDWNNFDDRRRAKWLLLLKRYLQTQMRDWAKLTPEQRAIARENYKKLAKQPPEKREAVKRKWQEHQQQKQTPSNSAPASPAAPSGDKAAPTLAPASPTR